MHVWKSFSKYIFVNIISSNIFNLNIFLKIALIYAYFAHHTFESEKSFLKESRLKKNFIFYL